MTENFTDVATALEPIKSYFDSVPGWVWFGLIILAALAYDRWGKNIETRRVIDERTGKMNGGPDPAPNPPIEYTTAGEPGSRQGEIM